MNVSNSFVLIISCTTWWILSTGELPCGFSTVVGFGLISKSLSKDGDTLVNINVYNDDSDLNFQLEKKRDLDRKTLNLLRNREILSTIN